MTRLVLELEVVTWCLGDKNEFGEEQYPQKNNQAKEHAKLGSGGAGGAYRE